jgi:hypothetical protein
MDTGIDGFLNALRVSSPPDGREDVHNLLLVNPTESQLRTLNDTAKRILQREQTRLYDFRGFRAQKIYNPSTNTTAALFWPSFCWAHSHMDSALTKLRGFTHLASGPVRFNYDDEDRKNFTPGKYSATSEWVHAGPEKIVSITDHLAAPRVGSVDDV